MSKLSFRARALDASKPMPIFRSEEIPDLPDFAAINRAVPQMPTGMEKEEECFHDQIGEDVPEDIEVCTVLHHMHPQLQGLVMVSTYPSLMALPDEADSLMEGVQRRLQYRPLPPKTKTKLCTTWHIRCTAFLTQWQCPSTRQLSSLHRMRQLPWPVGQLDACGPFTLQQCNPCSAAAFAMDQDIPDYDMDSEDEKWLTQQAKKMEINPLQFEEMMDRLEKGSGQQNRKNDEASYEKMLKLRRDLSRAVTLLEMVKRREKTKREHLHLTIEVFEKRYQVGDFNGQIMAEVMAMKNSRPSYVSVNNSQLSRQESRLSKHRSEDGIPRKKREYTKRRNKEIPSLCTSQVSYARSELEMGLSDMPSSDDEALSPVTSPSDNEDENDPDGPYAFKRKKYCNYHAPLLERLGNYPWCSPEEGGAGERKYRYCLTTLTVPKPHCIGFARRRIGRGGRILLDRAWTPLDDYWPDLDVALNQSMPNGLPPSNDFLSEVKNEW
ncbi:hypothetical protein HPB52_014049 [Rhipicephalus sanguineus]|uniref:Enhancer of polycomb-like protein n=1 Tax=Rhipicephalus sanguineus TaxID=34632 RepID=A0A9D4SV11_RHISA|nr:hypothetical protein HPB52_014049 [Rhipicephalus sanguineus]